NPVGPYPSGTDALSQGAGASSRWPSMVNVPGTSRHQPNFSESRPSESGARYSFPPGTQTQSFPSPKLAGPVLPGGGPPFGTVKGHGASRCGWGAAVQAAATSMSADISRAVDILVIACRVDETPRGHGSGSRASDEPLDLRDGRHRVGARETRSHDRAGGIRECEHPFERPGIEQPVAEGAAERVARAQTAQDFDAHAGHLDALAPPPRHGALTAALHDHELGAHRQQQFHGAIRIPRGCGHLNLVL